MIYDEVVADLRFDPLDPADVAAREMYGQFPVKYTLIRDDPDADASLMRPVLDVVTRYLNEHDESDTEVDTELDEASA